MELLSQGVQALKDGQWDRAKSCFDTVLQKEPENVRALLGRALWAFQVPDLGALAQKLSPQGQEPQPQPLQAGRQDLREEARIIRENCLAGYVEEDQLRQLLEFDFTYQDLYGPWKQTLVETERSLRENPDLARAEQLAQGNVRSALLHFYGLLRENYAQKLLEVRQQKQTLIHSRRADYFRHLQEAEDRARALHAQALQEQNKDFEDGCALLDQGSLEEARGLFLRLARSDYPQAREQLARCTALQQEQADRQAAQKKKKKRILLASTAAALVLVAAGLIFAGWYRNVGLPRQRYDKAWQLQQQGDLAGAAMAFGLAGDFQDAPARSAALWAQVTRQNTLAAGETCTLGIRDDGTLAMIGRHRAADLALGHRDLLAVDVGDGGILLLREDGSAALSGTLPGFREEAWQNLAAISMGRSHALGLRRDGTVMAAGPDQLAGTQVGSWREILEVSAGKDFSVGLKKDGTVVYAGGDEALREALATWSGIVSIAAGDAHVVGLRADGTVVAAGNDDYGQCQVAGWKNVVALSAGARHTVALRENSTVAAAGYGADGRCDVENWYGAVAVYAGPNRTAALLKDGSVVDAGARAGNVAEKWKDIQAVDLALDCVVALKKDGTLLISREDAYKEARSWKNITALELGDQHLLALTAEGTVLCAGVPEDHAQTVAGWTEIKQIHAVGDRSFALRQDGTVLAAGLSPEEAEALAQWPKAAALLGGAHGFLALSTDGSLLHLGPLNPKVKTWEHVTELATGRRHTVGLWEDGSVQALGGSNKGQCDLTGFEEIIHVDAGWEMTVGLKADGTVVITNSANTEAGKIVSGWLDILDIAVYRYAIIGLRYDGTLVEMGSYGVSNMVGLKVP